MAAELSPPGGSPRRLPSVHPRGSALVNPRGPTSVHPSPVGLIALGGAGSTALAVSTWWIGAVPTGWRPPPSGERVALYVLGYLGLAAVLASWLLLGRRLLTAAARPTPRALTAYLLACAAPLLGAAPFGRDLWAYAAQGEVVAHGLDPYTAGPAAVPGAFTAEVSGRWVHSPSPYGPVWLRLSQLGSWASHGHPTLAALLLRLPAFLALLACAWAVRRLAYALGGKLATGLWLGVASPLTIVLGVGGGHNDLPMLALALVGLALATRRGLPSLAAGAAVAAVGVLVKSPAAIAVAFAVPVWLHARGTRIDPRRVATAVAVAVVAAVATIAAGTAATGLGLGWTKQVNADAQWVSWLSLPSAIGMLINVAGGDPAKAVDATMRACRTAGEELTVLLLVGSWLLALRRLGDLAGRVRPAGDGAGPVRAAGERSRPPGRSDGNEHAEPDRRRVLGWLAAALGVAAVLAPSVQPWYYAWALAVAGLVVTGRRTLALLSAVAVVFPVMITPSGFGYESSWPAVPMLAGALALGWWVCSAPHHDDADHARAEMRADDRTQLGHV
jgi:hypothetical protein